MINTRFDWCGSRRRDISTAITHLKVPVENVERSRCLGPDGAVAHVARTLGMVMGRWKLPILFRLYADKNLRSSQLLRDIEGVSQKMLTQHLRELESDGLIERIDFQESPPRVEYSLTTKGSALMPALTTVRQFSASYPDRAGLRRPGGVA